MASEDKSDNDRSSLAFIQTRQAAQVAVDLKIAAGLRSVIVVQASVLILIQPDTWQHLKLLIGSNSQLHGD